MDAVTQGIAERMRLARRLAGLSQEETARRLKVAVRTYARWEKGDTEGFLSELDRIADVLGVPVRDLRGPAESPTLEERVDALAAEVHALADVVREGFARD